MGAVSSRKGTSEVFEAVYAANAEAFRGYLGGILRAESSATVDAEDALQEAMVDALQHWAELADVEPGERDRRLYRLIRDAASEALRKEHGRRDRRARAGTVSYDFDALDSDEADLEPRDRDLTVAVLGQVVRELIDTVEDQVERRVLTNRAVLLAGLRALTEREVVVLVAVEERGWDQTALAEHLGLSVAQVYASLFAARKLFYGVVRHALGIEMDEEERARLHAYRAGELTGRDRRLARRHLQHCAACKALVQEQSLFTRGAQHVLSPLPLSLGAGALAGPVARSAASGGRAGSGPASTAARGLLGQPGAAKALAATVGVLGLGVGVAGWLSIAHAPAGSMDRPAVAASGVSALSVRSPGRLAQPVVPAPASTPAPHRTKAKPHHATAKKTTSSPSTTSSSPPAATNVTPPSSQSSPPPASSPSSSSGATGGGSSSSGGSSPGGGQTEFFSG